MKKIYLNALALIYFIPSYAQSTFNIAINPEIKYQTIEDFGASDCWTSEYVGRYFSDTQKKQAAEWLFSKDTEGDGKPKGIGLSVWREVPNKGLLAILQMRTGVQNATLIVMALIIGTRLRDSSISCNKPSNME